MPGFSRHKDWQNRPRPARNRHPYPVRVLHLFEGNSLRMPQECLRAQATRGAGVTFAPGAVRSESFLGADPDGSFNPIPRRWNQGYMKIRYNLSRLDLFKARIVALMCCRPLIAVETTEYNSSLHRWSAFHKMKESKGFLWIYVTDLAAYAVPLKRPLLEGDVTVFMEKISSKAPTLARRLWSGWRRPCRRVPACHRALIWITSLREFKCIVTAMVGTRME